MSQDLRPKARPVLNERTLSQASAPRWIRFKPIAMREGAKTSAWDVRTKDYVGYLGQIRWASRWRCYAFYPVGDTYFEPQCLRDLADFLEQQTASQRANWKRSNK